MQVLCLTFIAFLLLVAYTFSYYIKFYIRAKFAEAPIPLARLMGMTLRKTPVEKIVHCYIILRKSEIYDITTDHLEAHNLAGGDIEKLVFSLVATKKNNLNVSFSTLSAMDLAGVDVVEAVKSAIAPHTVYVPSKFGDEKSIEVEIEGGVRLKIRVEVDVLTELELLVGGQGEDVLVDRVTGAVKWIVSELNTTDCDLISEELLKQKLDKRLSVKIQAIDVFILSVKESGK